MAMKRVADKQTIEQLQQQLQRWHKTTELADQVLPLGLGAIEEAYPGKAFPKGVLHEFISESAENAACTSGFLAVLLSKLISQSGPCLWVSTLPRRAAYPPALSQFSLDPSRIIFVDCKNEKQSLWVVEEALTCKALGAVVAELNELKFNDSRRLQLAAERSQVTALIHRFKPKTEEATACASRIMVEALPGETPDGLPGLGFPRWQLHLLKVKNGRGGQWQVEYNRGALRYLEAEQLALTQHERQTG